MIERSFDFYQTQSAKGNIKKCEAMKEMLKSVNPQGDPEKISKEI